MDEPILQGRTRHYLIGPLIEPDGSTTDLTSTTLRFMLKDAMATADAEAEIDHIAVVNSSGVITSGTGFTIGGTNTTVDPPVVYSGADSGVVTMSLSDEDTQDITPGPYLWELVVMRDGEVGQMRAGSVEVIDTLIHTPEVP